MTPALKLPLVTLTRLARCAKCALIATGGEPLCDHVDARDSNGDAQPPCHDVATCPAGRSVPELETEHGSSWYQTSDDRGWDLVAHLHRQREFSARTFGPGRRTAGVCDHIRKELREIEASPADVAEWVDVILLALDGAWRAGHEPAAIAAAIEAKQAENGARSWPDWRTAPKDKAIEHERAPAIEASPAVDLDALDEVHAQTPAGVWTAYCSEGPWGRSRRMQHSVCAGGTGDDHVCITTAVGDDEPQAAEIATFVALAHNAYPAISAELRRLRGVEADITSALDGRKDGDGWTIVDRTRRIVAHNSKLTDSNIAMMYERDAARARATAAEARAEAMVKALPTLGQKIRDALASAYPHPGFEPTDCADEKCPCRAIVLAAGEIDKALGPLRAGYELTAIDEPHVSEIPNAKDREIAKLRADLADVTASRDLACKTGAAMQDSNLRLIVERDEALREAESVAMAAEAIGGLCERHGKRIEKLEGELTDVRLIVEAARRVLSDFTETVEAAEARWSRCGMHVPYHGDFAAATPSVIKDLREWVARLRAALDAAKGG